MRIAYDRVLKNQTGTTLMQCMTITGLLYKIVATPIYFGQPALTVRDVTWMSDQAIHLAKWMAALEQVTIRHLVKCKLCQISLFF